MGTPEFAVPSLRILLENNFPIVAVVTPADKPSGRGLSLKPCPVKQFALDNNLLVLQPEKLQDESFVQKLKELAPDIQVIVAFRMLPEVVWRIPTLGTFNLHGSLLPQYRGAAPIHHAVLQGETETGVTTFLIDEKIDTGAILLQAKTPIHPDDTTGDVHDRLMQIGAELVLKTVNGLYTKTIFPILQNTIDTDKPLQAAPKLHTEFCKINHNQPAATVYNFIRGLVPYPVAYYYYKDTLLKIYKASIEYDTESVTSIGEYDTDRKSYLKLRVQDGFIHLLEVQAPNKKRLSIAEFLMGFQP